MPPPPQWLKSLIKDEALPSDFEDLAMTYYLPLSETIVDWAKQGSSPLILGVNGAQGTGKSTMSKVLSMALEKEHQLHCAIVSIDDIYLTRAERAILAEDVHPLLMTRGVPGTHDVSMGIDLIHQLHNKEHPPIPVFDKAIDDRAPREKWVSLDQPVDIIIFEGWCVGAIAQPATALATPCNQLEETEDSHAIWRTYANQKLEQAYTQLFNLIDRLIMLKAPDFECVHQWRRTQEEKLRHRHEEDFLNDAIMSDKEITRFIMHYERITRWMFEEMPKRADCVFELAQDHTIARAHYNDSR